MTLKREKYAPLLAHCEWCNQEYDILKSGFGRSKLRCFERFSTELRTNSWCMISTTIPLAIYHASTYIKYPKQRVKKENLLKETCSCTTIWVLNRNKIPR